MTPPVRPPPPLTATKGPPQVYAALLVKAASGPDGNALATLAIRLAQRFGMALTGVAAADLTTPLTAPMVGPVVVSGILDRQQAEIEAELEEAERDFRAAANEYGYPVAWHASVGNPASVLAFEARAADLVIIGRPSEAASVRPGRQADPGDVLMRAGRPVLVVPPGLSHLEAANIVVAWKDTREARRAVADALPVLRQASSVLVLEVCRSADTLEAAASGVRDVAAYLARYGVNATAEHRPLREATVVKELLLAAEEHRADLIVAGGYGHARLREWAFGGVTHALIHHTPKCCLLSH